MRRFSGILLAGLLLLSPVTARAQNDVEAFTAAIVSLNATPATRNPAYETYQQALNKKVLDTNRQWVGGVADLKIDQDGAVAEVVSEINQQGQRDYTVRNQAGSYEFLKNINAFVMTLPAGNVVTTPEALAAIAPAAGNGGEVYSFRAMKGAEVYNAAGNFVGSVKDVLVGDDMQVIRALVLENVPGARRYTEIAVPFDPAHVSFNTRFNRFEFRMSPEAAKAVTDYARERR